MYLLKEYFTTFCLVLTVFILFLTTLFKSKSKHLEKGIKKPPSPLSLPIIGHIYLLAKYSQNPWEGFNKIRENYGDVVSLKLGSAKAVLVSSTDAIKEVLLIKGDIFANRPHVYRHTLIFGRDRENSLALCDWSGMHKSRRALAQYGIIPKYGSKQFKCLNSCIQSEIKQILTDFDNENKYPFVVSKQFILSFCSDIFLNYLCSQRFSKECPTYKSIVYNFDYVFYEINQSYAVDFIPFLSLFGIYSKTFNLLENSSIYLRKWVEDVTVKPRFEEIANHFKDSDQVSDSFDDRDFLDTILKYYIKNASEMPWEIVLFEIGDLIGGQSAVGNLLMRLLGHVAVNEDIQDELFSEAKKVHEQLQSDIINLEHRSFLPLHEASVLETLRIASSPIVPHVATQDTTIQDYRIEKGTMVLFNSYYLNMSPIYWHDPFNFRPSRFLSKDEGHVFKPENFLPFSSGKRSCLGYKMVTTISLCTLANLLLKFKISPLNKEGQLEINEQLKPKGYLALSPDTCFKVALIPRTK